MKKILTSSLVALSVVFGSVTTADAQAAAAQPKLNPKTVIAKVGDRKIMLADLIKILQVMPPQLRTLPFDQVYDALREQAIQKEIFKMAAKKSGIMNTAEFKKEMESLREEKAAQLLVKKGAGEVKPEDVLKEYNLAKKEFKSGDKKTETEVRVIIASKEVADKVVKELGKGKKFAALAKTYSEHKETAKEGGLLGFVTPEIMQQQDPIASSAIFNLDANSYTKQPVPAKGGKFRVFYRGKTRDMKFPEFEVMKGLIQSKIIGERIQKLAKEHSKGVKVEYFTVDGKKDTSKKKS